MQELIFVPLLAQVGVALAAWRARSEAAAGRDRSAAMAAAEVWRAQAGLPLLFAVLSVKAYAHGIADAWVLFFAALFVAARMAHAYLHLVRRDPVTSAVAQRASAVALLAIAALLALDLWMPAAG